MALFAVDIDWHTLPKTFQDAVYTTARLKIKYIWIDALCIIQDSHEDWSIEAAEMTNVYANSSVGLSADASEDGHGGLFRERDPVYSSAFLIPRDNSSGHYLCFVDTWEHDVVNDTASLGGRAWAVQERFLAPRVIHFANINCTSNAYSLLPASSALILSTKPLAESKPSKDFQAHSTIHH
ncbi:unnamed protein product [Zymoseptoria tritici ST99CH_3D1]|uniref:Heterokaryon incompatibility domain-containing protein n=1 Tax=Zymoseptoria tritici ST99CH_1E4 TaxID=1276532 RepID=A0A2H1H841_ZYMTR|nr:unnamed protein product [Zymoseptoria tritici ST99CH_1E4]SMR64495.1 unnamed protein product [Zymoseptoria tritici ST99CH_3D1]